MKRLLTILLFLLPFQAHAKIFVCKDAQGNITYQDKSCYQETVRTLKNVPDAPIADQMLAHERIKKANAFVQERALLAETERLQQEKIAREYQTIALENRRLDLLEQQRLESERVMPMWAIGARPGYGYRYGFNQYGMYKYETHWRNANRPMIPRQKRGRQ